MVGMTCAEARLGLQDRHSSQESVNAVREHLRACMSCTQFAERQAGLDAVIMGALQTATQGVSVRRAVHTGVARKERRRALGRARGRGVLWMAAPLALVAAILAVALPQYATHLRDNESSAQVYTPVQPGIAYPLTIDPARPAHLLAGAFGCLYESWNSGNTWKPLAPFPGTFSIRDLIIDRTQPNRYIVASNRSILVSSDAGRHWRVTASALPGVFNMFLIQDDRHGNTFYVGPSVLWKSVDHGETWFQAGPGRIFAPYGIQALASAPNGTLYTAVWDGGVAVSHNGGRSWQRRSNGLTPKVFDVTAGEHILWAVGPSGIYNSRNNGLRWQRNRLNDRFMVTSVLATPGFVLAAGNGALYRSVDDGRHWVLGMDGLPPAPYVYDLTADPQNPDRVYASLNSNGIFRSDDGGQTWAAMNTGLPLSNVVGSACRILFLRRGVLWYTSTTGSDPGNLTVDEDVRLGVLSSDDNSVAYLSGTPETWDVKLVAAGGSGARTLIESNGDMPQRLLWAPDTTRVAAIASHTVYVSKLAGSARIWTLQSGDGVLGWTRDGRHLLVWERGTRRLIARRWDTGLPAGASLGIYAKMPSRSPDGSRLVALDGGRVLIGSIGSPLHAAGSVAGRCRLGPWSFDSTRLLVLCGSHVDIISPTGAVQPLPVGGAVTWLPGAHSQLLVFRQNTLWVESNGRLRVLVRNAQPPFSGSE